MYRSFDIETGDAELLFRYHFTLEPDIHFAPVTRVPIVGEVDLDALRPYVFHLGLVEAISYWKTACPSEFVIEAGVLSAEQIRFWYDLFIHGLGEFFYRNSIDFTVPDFFTIRNDKGDGGNKGVEGNKGENAENSSDLVLVGGGKDSAVALGMMMTSGRTIQTMIVNPTQAALANILAAGTPNPILIERTIDPALLRMNASGYLNGHTPFSAYLAFLGITIAHMYGNEQVIVSNERSADEGNVVYRGMEVNHQYSKSYRFEQMFRRYSADYFDDAPSYFSLLRPLNNMQIGMMFAAYPQFFPTFRSCNAGGKTNSWCGTCPKCAFTYLTLFPFIPYQNMLNIFGSDYFKVPQIIAYVRELAGLTPVKPFECVGTRDESKLAVVLSVEKYSREGIEIPEELLKIKSDLNLTDQEVAGLKEDVLNNWGDTYNLPPGYLSQLRNAWQRVSQSE